MWTRINIGLISLLVSYCGYGQAANDWINYSQQYVKMKVAAEGVYRVTAAELLTIGVPVNSIAATRYQVYRRGEELAINVGDANNDNVLDYLEFYGEKNDGSTDTDLYIEPAAQPHQSYNLFTDSAAYFLTWQLSAPGKRLKSSTLQSTNGSLPEAYHLQKTQLLQVNAYNVGVKYGEGFKLQSGPYDYGEGWSGPAIRKGQKSTFNLTLQDTEQAGPVPSLRMVLVGASNLDHLSEIWVGANESSLRLLTTAQFSGGRSYDVNESILWSDIAADGTFVVQVSVLGTSGADDQQRVSLIEVVYPSGFDEAGIYTFANPANGRKYVQVPSTQPATQRVWDISVPYTPVGVVTNPLASRFDFVFQDSSDVDRRFISFSTPLTVPSMQSVDMQPIDLSGKDYLIISHPTLYQSVGGVNPITEYISYRSGEAGGSHQVAYAEMPTLIDQYNYGDESSLAINHFLDAALQQGTAEYVLLVGKGTTVNWNYYRNPGATPHFVPTHGYPGSDVLLTVPSGGTVPRLAIGRLSVTKPQEILDYLDKVKVKEALVHDDLWQKRILQLSGGVTPVELRRYANFILNFKSIAETHYYGAKANNINKESTANVVVINIADEVNRGVSLITFFGHSGPAASDIELGVVSNPVFGYNNTGKYPVFLINGCNAGGIFTRDSLNTFGEDWVKTGEKGAVGFVANSEFAIDQNLRRHSNIFYQIAFLGEETFGIPMGKLMNAIVSRYFEIYGSSGESMSQVYQTLYQGDPAISIFDAEHPDYAVGSPSAIGPQGEEVLATMDSFLLKIPVVNYGKTIKDSLDVRVVRRLESGGEVLYNQSFRPVLFADTLHFVITNEPGLVVSGDNAFEVTLDPENDVTELQEINNSASFDMFLADGSTVHLFPLDFGIRRPGQVDLVWQKAVLTDQEDRPYDLEIDTLPEFDSPYLKRMVVDGGLLARQSVSFTSLPDSTVVYWRTRFLESRPGEDNSWVTSSFGLVEGTADGWAQLAPGQLARNQFGGVSFDQTKGTMEFLTSTTPLAITTHGTSADLAYVDYQVQVEGGDILTSNNAFDPRCRVNTLNAVVFSNESGAPYRPINYAATELTEDKICGRLPQLIYNFTMNDMLGSGRYLDSLITLMNKGDGIALFTFDSVSYSQFDARMLASLGELGIAPSVVNGLSDGAPAILIGRKGASAGSAQVLTDNGGGLPVKEQQLSFVGDIQSTSSSGSITTSRLGPARQWQQLFFDLSTSTGDAYDIEVFGISPDGTDLGSQLSGDKLADLDVSSIDASIYPYLYLKLNFSNEETLIPLRLNDWGLAYERPAEGVLLPAQPGNSNLQEGQEYRATYDFLNISGIDYEDSIDISIRTVHQNTQEVSTQAAAIPALLAGDSSSIQVRYDTRQSIGKHDLYVSALPRGVEQYPFNNDASVRGAFTVVEDDTRPIVDVTFDGYYILDGDIVSPSPIIRIAVKDENTFLLKEDTAGVTIELRRPGAGQSYEQVALNSPQVTYSPATTSSDFEVVYTPGTLEDGVYSLRVQAADASGNQGGEVAYEIAFEIVNESAITHFYPYPNPFSTACRFVYTLTGSVLPDEIKVQVMTVSGRVVRELSMNELGVPKIGNNITELPWDGTDEYGDRLANGVYFYKVFIQMNGQTVKHRETAGDKAFRHGFGKLYILR